MTDLAGIKNIFFDLGGVLLDIDFKKTYDAFEALGIQDAHNMNDRPEVLSLFMDLEMGVYTKAEFLEEFRELVVLDDGPPLPPLERGGESRTFYQAEGNSPSLPKEGLGWISDKQLIDAFNALLLDFIPGHIELVQKLSSTYRVFLLSNTNAIHAECYNGRLKANYGIENLDCLMEKAFYSHDLGCRKPDKQIYLKALELAGVKAEESLFIDDMEINVEAARECGMRSVLVDGEFSIKEIFG